MIARRRGLAWEVLAPAKLNFTLDVLGRRSDGFHELETLMVPAAIYDRLRWSPTSGFGPRFSFEYHESTPANLRTVAPADESNLVWRAVHLLARRAGIEPVGRFTLLKRIPVQAGLGGGSSDAAAALMLANTAWGLGYDAERLAPLAAELGSDVPFFLCGQAAICRGRGELVEPVGNLPSLPVVVVAPPAGVSTAEAFGRLTAGNFGNVEEAGLSRSDSSRSRQTAALLAGLRTGRWNQLGRLMVNGLEQVAAELCPWIVRLRREFARLGFRASLMTGSGSAYFGLAHSAAAARRAARRLAAQGLGEAFATATCRHP